MAYSLLTRAFTEIGILIISSLIIALIVKLIFKVKIWYGSEPIYMLFKSLERNLPAIIVALVLLGLIIILIRAWLKAVSYLEDVINATENVYTSNNALVELPEELKEVEAQMNQIKMNLMEKERIAKEAEQRKNDLVVYLAHDLKTPLTSVIGYLSILKDEPDIPANQRDKYISIVLEKAQRLEDLINEFFEITRYNLSTIILEISRINMTRMLEQIVYEYYPMLSEKRVSCIIDAPQNVMLNCDIDKMQRVFDNLLKNAMNYSFEDTSIEIRVQQTVNEVKISFVNHGTTIPKEKLERIFEQFYRLNSARQSKSGGSGLGLAIVREIVELHGGTISAYSENELITFEIIMPYF
ncbi:MAG: HAMP domain-containing sensor histidine kinase [Bacillota bacterium]|nr:HAMP domain-containing sensor histidine kinase [Bacillota bacterium]